MNKMFYINSSKNKISSNINMKLINNIKKSANKKILRDFFNIKNIRELRTAWGLQGAKPQEIYEIMAFQYNLFVEGERKDLAKAKAKAKREEAAKIFAYKLSYECYLVATRKVKQKSGLVINREFLKYEGKKVFMFQSKTDLKLSPFIYLNHVEEEMWNDYKHKGQYVNYPVATTEGQSLNYFPNNLVIKDALAKIGGSKNIGIFYNLQKERLHKKDSKLKNMKLFYAFVNCPNPSFRGFEDKGDMQCVPNILHHHLTQNNMNKKLKVEHIVDMLDEEYYDDIDEGYKLNGKEYVMVDKDTPNAIQGVTSGDKFHNYWWVEKGKRGYTAMDVVRVLNSYRCPFKLLDICEEIFMFDNKKETKDKNLLTFVGQVYNHHLYYCNDRHYVKSMAQTLNALDSKSAFIHDKKKDEIEDNFDGIVLQQEDLTQDYIDQFQLDRTVRKVKLFDDKIVSIKYDDGTIYANNDKDVVEDATKNLDIPFKNQNLTTVGMIVFKAEYPNHKKSCFNTGVFNTLKVNAGIVEGFGSHTGGKLTQIDINKCRTNCLMNNKMGAYPIFDINNDWEVWDGTLDKIGYYYAETNNRLPMRKNNIYSGEFLKKCQAEGIKFKVTHQLIAEDHYDEDYFKEFAKNIVKASPDNFKKIENSFIGCCGKTISKAKTGYIETDYNEAVAKFWQNPNIGSVYNLDDRIQTERIRGKDVTENGYDMIDVGTIKMDDETNHYLVQKTHAEKLYENDLPIYNKVLENEWWNVYELYKKTGGKLLKIKTDCVIIENQEREVEFNNEIGGYKKETITSLPFCHDEDKEVVVKEFQTEYEWKELVDVEWDDTDNYFEPLRKKLPDTSMLITGLAGMGKSELAKNLECYEKAIVLAFTNKATEGLLGKTICKYFGIDFTNGKYCRKKLNALKNHTHIIVDECFMCPPFCIKVFNQIKKMHPHIKWICVGDPEQTRPVTKEHINWLSTKVFYDLCDGNRVTLKRNMRNPKATKTFEKIIAGGDPTDRSNFTESEINITRTNKKRMEINDYYMEKNCNINSYFIPNDDYHEKAQDVFLNEKTPVMSIITNEDLGIVNSGIYEIESLNPIIVNGNEYTDIDFMKTFVVCYAMTNHKVQSVTIHQPFVIHEWYKMTARERYTAYSRGTKKENIKIIY